MPYRGEDESENLYSNIKDHAFPFQIRQLIMSKVVFKQ